jgi:hypothetical protein
MEESDYQGMFEERDDGLRVIVDGVDQDGSEINLTFIIAVHRFYSCCLLRTSLRNILPVPEAWATKCPIKIKP